MHRNRRLYFRVSEIAQIKHKKQTRTRSARGTNSRQEGGDFDADKSRP